MAEALKSCVRDHRARARDQAAGRAELFWRALARVEFHDDDDSIVAVHDSAVAGERAACGLVLARVEFHDDDDNIVAVRDSADNVYTDADNIADQCR